MTTWLNLYLNIIFIYLNLFIIINNNTNFKFITRNKNILILLNAKKEIM